MTQLSATKLIRELEDMQAVPLLERGRRGMKPRHYGEVIQRHVSILMSDLTVMQEELARIEQGATGHCGHRRHGKRQRDELACRRGRLRLALTGQLPPAVHDVGVDAMRHGGLGH